MSQLDLKTTGFICILFWILVWGFGDEVKDHLFRWFESNTQKLISLSSLNGADQPPLRPKGIISGQ